MTLPGFEIHSVVARSEHTLVRRARRERDGRAVVLKQPASAYPPLIATRRLELEYRLLSKLRVPGVIEALELVFDEGHPVLVLEDFGARDLGRSVAEPLAPEALLDVALRAARALGEIHARGVVHKDVKPHNLLLNSETGRLKLIDFQLATELSREHPELSLPRELEGSLPYMSPEQTGRMNRSLDYRTDYYSLGVSLFQLLTGRLPFEADDAMGWVHAHLSRPPLEAASIADVPRMLSAILTKLMAKDADQRYQSAQGLVSDLEACRTGLSRGRTIAPFVLAADDFSEKFCVSQRLVGRTREVACVLEAFERASAGRAELLLIDGPSGIGKSSVVREVVRAVSHRRGRFATGKLDQLERKLPYGVLTRALGQLVRQILNGSESGRERYRTRILDALGGAARVMVELVGELEHLLGPTPEPPELGPTEARTRFRRAFVALLSALSHADEPLVLFLDDLQWSDASTPELLVDVLLAEEPRHLLLIGAYRDEEVDDTHPLALALERLRALAPEAVQHLTVGPLSRESVAELCADSLRAPLEQSQALGQIVYEKTAGNPFFATELLAALERAGAITLVRDKRRWHCDLDALRRAPATDNVISLLVSRLHDLPADAQRALSVAACLEEDIDLDTLAELLERPPAETARALWEPVRRGLLVPQGDQYRLAESTQRAPSQHAERLRVRYHFPHDRVRQAAYSLIEPGARAATHLSIGRRLLASREAPDVFEITHHLNLGRALLVEGDDERERAMRLNVSAAARAKQATAYASACAYLRAAIELAGPAAWSRYPAERFEMGAELVECVLMSGDAARAAAACQELSRSCRSRLERATVHLLESRIAEAEARFEDAVRAAQRGLEVCGVALATDPKEIERLIELGIARMQQHLVRRSPEALLELPDMVEPEKILAMRLLFQAIPPAIQLHPPLFLLITLTMFDLALSHGLSPVSAKNLVDCGIIQGGLLGDYPTAYRLGKAAFAVLERYRATAIASSVNFVFAAYVSSWKAPPDEALNAFQECLRVGMETGDVQHVGFGTALRLHRLLYLGHELPEVRRELSRASALTERLHLPSQRTALVQVERALARLCDDEAPSARVEAERAATERVLASKNPQWIYAYAEAQMMVSLILDEDDDAERWRRMAEPFVPQAVALISVPEYHLGEALLIARRYASLGEAERRASLSRLGEIAERLGTWAAHCPESFAHKHELVLAERARLEGAPLEVVLEHYERAAEATGHFFIHLRALAFERQARFWGERKRSGFQKALLERALALYRRWGATNKVEQLAEELDEASLRPSWLPLTRSLRPRYAGGVLASPSVQGVSHEALDLASVIKATLAFSSAVKTDQLFESLMATLLENAAAEHGSLISCDEDTGVLSVEAQARVGSATRVGTEPLESARDVCAELVRYALRSGEPLVVDDAGEHPDFCQNPYIVQGAVKSVLCLPIQHQGKLVAAFYAENNMARRAFSPERVSTLLLLSSQAAISIVNARLYASLEQKVEERTRELARKNREVLALLDGMDQGVVSIDAELEIQPPYSERLTTLLGTRELEGRPFLPLLFQGSNVGQGARAATEMALRFSHGSPPAVAQLNAGHLVRELVRQDPSSGAPRHLEVTWSPIVGSDGNVERFLVVLRDVSVLKQLEQAQAAAARETEILTSILGAGVDEFKSFCAGSRELFRRARERFTRSHVLDEQTAQRLFRDFHTVKGSARALGLVPMVDEVHAVEALLDQRLAIQRGPMRDAASGAAQGAGLLARIDALEALVSGYEAIGQKRLGPLWTGESDRLRQTVRKIEAVLEQVRNGPSEPAPALARIEQTLRQSRGLSLAALFDDVLRGLPSLARELGKPSPLVEHHEPDITLAPTWARIVKDSLSHALRNALDHGIEPEPERLARGKPARGHIRLCAEPHSNGLCLTLADDGRGLALARLRQQSGDGVSDELVAQRIFEPGVTTKERVTRVSGRGIGMGAVQSAVEANGGRVSLRFTGRERLGYRPFELVLELPEDALVD